MGPVINVLVIWQNIPEEVVLYKISMKESQFAHFSKYHNHLAGHIKTSEDVEGIIKDLDKFWVEEAEPYTSTDLSDIDKVIWIN